MHVNYNIEMVETVASGLGELLENVVFIGGSVLSLYTDDPAAIYIRPTKDVDCIIEFANRIKFTEFEKRLRAKGFKNDISEGAPICRWIYNDIPIDIMPTDEQILSFTNQWYKEGFLHLTQTTLPNGIEIAILDLPYFIATKIEAFYGREESDFRISHDIEDIIILLDGIISFEKIFSAPDSVRRYLKQQFGNFLKKDLFIESVSAHIDQGHSPARTKRIIAFLNNFCETRKSV